MEKDGGRGYGSGGRGPSRNNGPGDILGGRRGAAAGGYHALRPGADAGILHRGCGGAADGGGAEDNGDQSEHLKFPSLPPQTI